MTYTYALIDEDGTLVLGGGTPTMALVDELVGEHGWARVWLSRRRPLHGWVSDCGLVMPERYRRNVVGSCVLASLGAGRQPYAGPVLITGYDYGSDWGGPEPIGPQWLEQIRVLRREVRRALDGADDTVWYAEMREFAELVRSAETPGLTFRRLQ